MSFIVLILSASITVASGQHPSIHQLQQEEYRDKPAPLEDKVMVRTGLDVLLSERLEVVGGKTIGLVTNHSGVDQNGTPNYRLFMDLESVNLKIVFSPEHGLFGDAAAGEKVDYQETPVNFPELFSLYGKNRKPPPETLAGLDLIVYDIQDVGARFYTYISTLGLVMEAAAEAGLPIIVLDRPAMITGQGVEGPVLNMDFRSFVGFYPIPTRYGLTIGELSRMVVGEGWIDGVPDLQVIAMDNWERSLWMDETTIPWVKPSPNIPDLETALIYPGLCLLEGTNVSEGRGTEHPFRWFGAPWVDGKIISQDLNKLHLPGVVFKPIQFTPRNLPGIALNPKYESESCQGIEIVVVDRNALQSVSVGIHVLDVLQTRYPAYLTFKIRAFDRLWGGSDLRESLLKGHETEDIISDLQGPLSRFTEIRQQYLLY